MATKSLTELVFLVVLVLVCLILAALAICMGGSPGYTGGAMSAPAPKASAPKASARWSKATAAVRSPHLVVDTLNLAHWYLGQGHRDKGSPVQLTPDAIVGVIDATAPTLKQRHKDRVIYVLKDRESQFDDAEVREKYRLAAERNKVYVSVASRYAEPPAGDSIHAPHGQQAEHSSKGRDDFYMSLLASPARYRCAVLTADKLRDFSSFRATIPPFYVIDYAYWRDSPDYEFVRPSSAAYARIRKPWTVHPSEYFSPSPPSS